MILKIKMNKLAKKIITRETSSYIVVGILTTLVGLIIYQISLNIGFNIIEANTISTFVAILFAYISNKLWVFQSLSFEPRVLIKEFFIFLSSRFATYIIDTTLLIILVANFLFDPLISKIFTSVLIIILNYIASKKMVFNKKNETLEALHPNRHKSTRT